MFPGFDTINIHIIDTAYEKLSRPSWQGKKIY